MFNVAYCYWKENLSVKRLIKIMCIKINTNCLAHKPFSESCKTATQRNF